MQDKVLLILEQYTQKKIGAGDGLMSAGIVDAALAQDILLEIGELIGKTIDPSQADKILQTAGDLIAYVEANK